MESRPFSTYFWPILTYLELFNQNGAFTVEEGHDDLSFPVIKEKLLNSVRENWVEVKSRPFWTYFQPLLTYLERFNENGAFTVEEGHNDLSLAVTKRKVTGQFLIKLGISGI